MNPTRAWDVQAAVLPRRGDHYRVECRVKLGKRVYIREFIVSAEGAEVSDMAMAASRAFAIIAKEAAHAEAEAP